MISKLLMSVQLRFVDHEGFNSSLENYISAEASKSYLAK
jgi:hypothetical protein